MTNRKRAPATKLGPPRVKTGNAPPPSSGAASHSRNAASDTTAASLFKLEQLESLAEELEELGFTTLAAVRAEIFRLHNQLDDQDDG
jgi:hypothetical protein